MGMSASQARLISLTARMNDIEYQGQQINQQRTTLASQINALYNTLLDMSVPTPPSTQDFTKVVYSGTQDASKFNIGDVVPTGKNSAGKDTYSIDFKYKLAGHAVSKNTNSATLTNTTQFLKYKPASEDVKKDLFTQYTVYTPGTQITNSEDLAEIHTDDSDPTANDVLISTTVDSVAGIDRTGLTILDTNGKDITNNLPTEPSTPIYIKCNSDDINDQNPVWNLITKTPILVRLHLLLALQV